MIEKNLTEKYNNDVMSLFGEYIKTGEPVMEWWSDFLTQMRVLRLEYDDLAIGTDETLQLTDENLSTITKYKAVSELFEED